MAGALEVHASALQDSLIDGMSFGSRSGTASYILSRKSVSFPPQSGGTFEPAKLRLLRFSLQDAVDGGSSGWIDGSTLRLAFVFHNKTEGNVFYDADLPAAMFRRLRVICGGVEVHDITDYGRTCQMFSLLLPSAGRLNDVAEGFGGFNHDLSQIAPNENRRVLTQLLAPIFQAQQFLPIALMGGLVIELELDNYDAAFVSEHEEIEPQWEILQPYILVDSIQVDPPLSSSYARHLFGQKSTDLFS